MRLSVSSRRGLSILEVLISLMIFLLAYGALHQLMSNASQQARMIHYRSQAARLAQSLLNEVVAGSIPLTASVNDAPVPDDPEYLYTMISEGSVLEGLYTVRVKVSRSLGDEGQVDYTVAQMMLDPAMVGSNQDQLAIQGMEETQGATASESTGESTADPMNPSTPTPPTAPAAPTPPSGGGGGRGGLPGNLNPATIAQQMPALRNMANQLPANVRSQIPANLLPSGGGGGFGGGGRGGMGGGGGRGGR